MNLQEVKELIDKEKNSNNWNDVFCGYKGVEYITAFGIEIKFLDSVGQQHDGESMEVIIEIDGKAYSIPYGYSSWGDDDIDFNDIHLVEYQEVKKMEWVKINE